MKPSGIRLGTPALTTRGMKEPEMRQIAAWIACALEHRTDAAKLAQVRGAVLEMAERFPLYGWLRA
jgi:glycine hydroxymethyltransferase